MSSGILDAMNRSGKPSLNQVLAKNLAYFMARDKDKPQTARALAIAAGISPNSVSNILKPHRRTVTDTKPEGFPTLDKLEKIANALGRQLWELLHPDIEKSLREREMYKQIQENFDSLSKQAEKESA